MGRKPGGGLLLLLCACVRPAPAPQRECVRLLVDETETAFHDPRVLSVDDRNERYEITLGGRPLETGEAHAIALALGELRLSAQAWGRSGDEGSFVFQATPSQARTLAAALGVPAAAREPWRGELSGKLEPAQELSAGSERVPLRFTLSNSGPLAFWFLDGGRGRNELGRDNRFTFEIEREGERLPVREIPDFGGLGSYRRLAPGESRVLELDLAHWCRLERAGKYVLRTGYEADLMPAEFEPGRALPLGWHAHLARTRVVRAELAFELR